MAPRPPQPHPILPPNCPVAEVRRLPPSPQPQPHPHPPPVAGMWPGTGCSSTPPPTPSLRRSTEPSARMASEWSPCSASPPSSPLQPPTTCECGSWLLLLPPPPLLPLLRCCSCSCCCSGGGLLRRRPLPCCCLWEGRARAAWILFPFPFLVDTQGRCCRACVQLLRSASWLLLSATCPALATDCSMPLCVCAATGSPVLSWGPTCWAAGWACCQVRVISVRGSRMRSPVADRMLCILMCSRWHGGA